MKATLRIGEEWEMDGTKKVIKTIQVPDTGRPEQDMETFLADVYKYALNAYEDYYFLEHGKDAYENIKEQFLPAKRKIARR